MVRGDIGRWYCCFFPWPSIVCGFDPCRFCSVLSLSKYEITQWEHLATAIERAIYIVTLPKGWRTEDNKLVEGLQAVVKFPLHPASYGAQVC